MKTTVTIQNLKCAGCESIIAKKLHKLKGIKGISVNINNCNVSFSYETEDGIETVQKELTKLGYPIEKDKNRFILKRKSFTNCPLGQRNI